MKKIIVITQSKDSDSVVSGLRELGVLHVEHQAEPKGADIAKLQEDITLLEKAIQILSINKFAADSGTGGSKHGKHDWREAATHIVDSWKRIDQLEEYSQTVRNLISQWEEWGDFNPDDLTGLASKNLFMKLCQIPTTSLKQFPADVVVKIVSAGKGYSNCVAVSDRPFEMPFKEIIPPKMSLSKMRERLDEDAKAIRELKIGIEKLGWYFNNLGIKLGEVKKELELRQAINGMGRHEDLAYIAGFIPADAAQNVSGRASKEGWGILIKDPSAEDTVPTLVRSPRWVSVISPVFKLIEIVPGYNEMDISPVFLLFLGLFFGMIIGDAGYGLVYMLLTLFAQKKMGKKMKDHRVFHLLYLFSGFAVMWGVLTGTIFGQEWYLNAGFKALIPVLNDTKFLQAFCFFIGAVHLTIGQGWQAVRKIPSLTALADVGWILILWAAYFLARMLILSDPLPSFTKWLIITGSVLVIFCTSPQRNVLKMVGAGLGATALNIMNNFTDVVSYVRLFAVGLAGVAISDTVNSLAGGMGDNFTAKFMVLFLGHTINVVLGPMSVLVHGIRLNVLEFSSHAGLAWSGIAYKPLNNK